MITFCTLPSWNYLCQSHYCRKFSETFWKIFTQSTSWRVTVVGRLNPTETKSSHDDVTKWKHFRRYCTFVRGIHRFPVNSPHKGQWRGALMFSLVCNRINGWVNNGEAGDLRRHRAHYDVTVMNWLPISWPLYKTCVLWLEHSMCVVQWCYIPNRVCELVANDLTAIWDQIICHHHIDSENTPNAMLRKSVRSIEIIKQNA